MRLLTLVAILFVLFGDTVTDSKEAEGIEQKAYDSHSVKAVKKEVRPEVFDSMQKSEHKMVEREESQKAQSSNVKAQ